MSDLFYSARLTLVHAQQHIRDFDTHVHNFVNGKPYAHIVEQDPNSGNHVHKIKFTQKVPEMLPCTLFDIANNLRAVLDQAGYAAALASGNTRLKRTNFPFGDDAVQLDNNIDGRKVCEDCPAEIVALFRAQKPYKGGNNDLWALNKLCNTKKHCALVPVEINKSRIVYTADIIGAGWAAVGQNTFDADKNEITFLVTKPGVQPRVTPDLTFDVTISDIETLTGKQAGHVLANMSSVVQGILMATEAECRRLGFQLGN
jgi:hypothetical protein